VTPKALVPPPYKTPLAVKDAPPEPPFATVKAVERVKLVADAAPRIGVTRVGEVERTTLPDPVEVVTPVPPDTTGSVPDAIAVPATEYNAPLAVNDVTPVPPASTGSVPAVKADPEVL